MANDNARDLHAFPVNRRNALHPATPWPDAPHVLANAKNDRSIVRKPWESHQPEKYRFLPGWVANRSNRNSDDGSDTPSKPWLRGPDRDLSMRSTRMRRSDDESYAHFLAKGFPVRMGGWI